MVSLEEEGKVLKDWDRLSERARCIRDLFYLATEHLGYTLLTKDFHEPICKWIVDHEREPFLWFAAARDHYKTTIQVADLCRHILIDPNKTHMALHAVDDEAQKFVEETGQHFLTNKSFRKLMPEIMPHPMKKRWLSSSKFTVARSEYDRQPTVQAKSTGAESTGIHITGSIRPDDIIGRNTIEDSQLPVVKRWWQSTIMPVRRPGCVVRGSGTRWDINDIYGEWIEDPMWATMVRAARETDGKPDYKGKSVLYSENELKLRETQMGPMFPPQMMNDPSPAGEKPWDQAKCEHFVTLQELRLMKGRGVFVVLSDPAEAKHGSLSGIGEKARGDGTKDYWATCLIRLMAVGQRRVKVLFNGRASQSWSRSEGLKVVADFMLEGKTPHVGIEQIGGLGVSYDNDMRLMARKMGTVGYQKIELKQSRVKNAKNLRFGALADMAKKEEFLICKETCDQEFLEFFLKVCRNWRPLPGGRNSNKYDDPGDVVAYCTDPGLDEIAPQPSFAEDFWDETDKDEADNAPAWSRYCAV